ncbi:hypothetical protein RDWZM_008223 [Blomia tropicalis]|uniref:UDP-glycosyltransferase n=1 Tax=Blomia tropicalis TaxID=40697 RepID=A0A9Q0M116_BLOTA|nr:hypothetical protein RDWZM_008223 [Blomia tropicalis]
MKKLTILVSAINAVGHSFEGKLKKLGYEEYVYSIDREQPTNVENKPDDTKIENPGERMAQLLLKSKIIGPSSPLEKMEQFLTFFEDPLQRNEYKHQNRGAKEAIDQFNPDLIFVDTSLVPVIYYSNIPWIKCISTTPNFFFDDSTLPPPGSGLPINDNTDWHLFEKFRREFTNSTPLANLIKELGYEPYPDNITFPETQLLTVYAYPNELNWNQIRQKDWFNLEFVEDSLNNKWSGKWIYVSMGSMGSVDLDLMKRLISALQNTPHKYIVSKGPRHEELELAANMYGERYLPQTKIVPLVDLVITHGGNNTTTETFAVGKPMIVFPLFGDQFDNAQRLEETGLGARLEPYGFTEKQLTDKIDHFLNDQAVLEKLQNASKRIMNSNKPEELAIKLEQLLCKDN